MPIVEDFRLQNIELRHKDYQDFDLTVEMVLLQKLWTIEEFEAVKFCKSDFIILPKSL